MSGMVIISDRTAWSVGSSCYLWAIEPLAGLLMPDSRPKDKANSFRARVMEIQRDKKRGGLQKGRADAEPASEMKPIAEVVDEGIEARILDLTEVSSSDLKLVWEALKAIYATRVEEGGGRFKNSSIHEEYLRAFRALIGLVSEDPRVGSPIYIDEAKDSNAGVNRQPDLPA